jgi:hypothetical protein
LKDYRILPEIAKEFANFDVLSMRQLLQLPPRNNVVSKLFVKPYPVLSRFPTSSRIMHALFYPHRGVFNPDHLRVFRVLREAFFRIRPGGPAPVYIDN